MADRAHDARFQKASDADEVRVYTRVHDGEGTIRIRSFFTDANLMGIFFQVWEVEPGASEGPHAHVPGAYRDDFEEFYYVLEGTGVAVIDDDEIPLRKGDALLVPPNVNHGLANRSTDALRILLVFGSPAATRGTSLPGRGA